MYNLYGRRGEEERRQLVHGGPTALSPASLVAAILGGIALPGATNAGHAVRAREVR